MLINTAEADNESEEDETDFLLDEHDTLEEWFLSIMVEPRFVNFPKVRKQITIDSYIPATFGNKFRFRSREDMRRLLHAWRLPDNIILEDGSSISGEFVLLFSIRRLATHTNLDDFAQFEFGREYSVLSRVFNFFVRYTYHTFRDKLSNNIPFFVHKFPEKMKARGMPLREIYFSKCLLRNCYNCLYHSKASKFFECPPPTLEEYMLAD